MKQLLLLIILSFVLASCSDKDGESTSADTTHTITTSVIDTLKPHNNPSGNTYYGSNDRYFEALNQDESQTIVTYHTEIYSDSLLQHPSGISISPGEDVMIEKHCGNVVNGNWDEPVYKISYSLGDKTTRGFISQSKIACLQDTLQSNKIVLLTLDYNNESDKFTGNVFFMDQTRKILSQSQITFDIYKEGEPPYAFYYYFSIGEIEKNVGLEGIVESFYISAGYDACGYPHITNIFLWNGKQLILAPETYSVSDAGVFYANGELLFPSDSLGREGYVVHTFEVVEQIDGPDNPPGVEYYNKDSTVILYKWNKINHTFSKADTILTKSRKYSYQTTEY